MVGGDHEQVALPERPQHGRQRGVKRLQRGGIALHVVAVAVEHVKIDQIGEDQLARPALQKALCGGNTRRVVFRMVDRRDAAVAEDVLDLADADHLVPRPVQRVQDRVVEGRERIIAPVFRAPVVARFTEERARNDAADQIVALQQFPRHFTDVVQLFQRNHPFVRGDLEHAVRRGVDDGFAGADMLVPQALDDLRAACYAVAERPAADGLLEPAHQVCRKAVRIGAERLVQVMPRHLPVAAGGILGMRALRAAAIGARGRGHFVRQRASLDVRKAQAV